MSYTIDVYRGARKPARRDFLDFRGVRVVLPAARRRARSSARDDLLPQLSSSRGSFDVAACIAALRLMLWGFFKKVVVADNCRAARELRLRARHAAERAVGAARRPRVAVQIYCDFSGYTDIARGVARAAGLRADAELRPTRTSRRARGVLAALAHLAVDVVPRLRLHPARRQSRHGQLATLRNLWSPCCWPGCGTARAGRSCCGARFYARAADPLPARHPLRAL